MSMPIEIKGETYLSTQEACNRLGVSRETLRKYVRDRGLQQYKKGIARTIYYKQVDLDRFMGMHPIEEDEG